MLDEEDVNLNLNIRARDILHDSFGIGLINDKRVDDKIECLWSEKKQLPLIDFIHNYAYGLSDINNPRKSSWHLGMHSSMSVVFLSLLNSFYGQKVLHEPIDMVKNVSVGTACLGIVGLVSSIVYEQLDINKNKKFHESQVYQKTSVCKSYETIEILSRYKINIKKSQSYIGSLGVANPPQSLIKLLVEADKMQKNIKKL